MAEQEIPIWVTETLPELIYQLIVWEGDGSEGESVDLTRNEYIALKAHLAAMRGYKTITPIEAIKLVGDFCDAGSRDSARHLQIAREIYQGHPELIMNVSEEFDAELAELAR
jgi:hypothetical protein